MPRHSQRSLLIEAIEAYREERIFRHLNTRSPEAAHFLASHPDIHRKWREDLIDFQRQEGNVI